MGMYCVAGGSIAGSCLFFMLNDTVDLKNNVIEHDIFDRLLRSQT